MFSPSRLFFSSATKRLITFCRCQSTFKCSDITIVKTEKEQAKPDASRLVFGKSFSDHMFVARWTSAHGWDAPEIKPLAPFELHPGAKVLHYAQEIFEGMKAYRGVDGIVRLFRPEMNAKRMLKTSERACLPTFDIDEWVNCVKAFIVEEMDWVPPCDPKDLTKSPSYYIRPFSIGVEPALGVSASSEVLLCIIGGPVGPYYATGFKPVSLLADPSLVRSWPGGTGFAKMGSNYAPTLALQKHAALQGCQQVLWLFGKEHNITEVGTMNLFVVVDKGDKLELITPPLSSGLILPGVTRDSIIQLAHDWPDVVVTEREMSLLELLRLHSEKKIVEVFGAGTAAIVSPVGEIVYNGVRYNVLPPKNATSLSQRAVEELVGMQFGKPEQLKKKPSWIVPVC